jgi:DNA invertase Pin-like site-specific DNA recombinase
VEGYSLDAQRREIKRYCEHSGYELVSIYADEGVSAHTDRIDKRPQLSALLADACRGLFDVVVVHMIDRWARKISIQAQALTKLGEAKVGFLSVSENIDFSTPHGRFLLTTLGGASELFSDLLGVHVAKAQKERAEQGLPIGPVPFGYRLMAAGGCSGRGSC